MEKQLGGCAQDIEQKFPPLLHTATTWGALKIGCLGPIPRAPDVTGQGAAWVLDTPVWATAHVAWPKLGQSQGFRVNLALCESGVVLDLFGPQSLFSSRR